MNGDEGGVDPRERRVILVASKKGLERLIEKTQEQSVIDSVIDNAFPLIKLAKYSIEGFAGLQGKGLSEKPLSELKKVVDSRLNLGVIPYLVGPVDALKLFNFDVGHTPTDGSIYIQHPIYANFYIEPAKFSRRLSKEKEAAFRKLASSLGAKRLTLINGNVKTTKGLFGATVPLQQAAGEVGISASMDKSGSLVSKVYCEYGPPRSAPWVPPDLQLWVDMDPDLRTMAHDRMSGHLIKSSITLEFKEEIGVGGELAAKLASQGFGVKGSYEEICHASWSFDVEYYPIE